MTAETFHFKHLTISRPLAFLDLETTGLDPEVDRIVEWTVLRIETDGMTMRVTHRCNPGVPISPGASAVHGIVDADVAGYRPFAERTAELAARIVDADLSGFGIAGFDLPMLTAEMDRAGYDVTIRLRRRILDVMAIYHAVTPFSRTRRRTLTRAVATFCGKEHAGAHGSAADALAAAEVLDGILATHIILPRSFDDLCREFGSVPPEK